MALDCVDGLTRLSRPRLLARAARAGMALYKRDRDLAGLLKNQPRSLGVVPALVAAEAACENERRAGAPGYSAARHVRALTALLVEARAAATRRAQPKASGSDFLRVVT